MSDLSAKGGGLSRRAVTIGGGIATALGLAALGVSVPRWLGKHYAKTPYDDLLGLLTDREAATRVGQGVIADIRKRYPIDGIAETRDRDVLARELRSHIQRHSLRQQMSIELDAHTLFEAGGWVVPSSLAFLCMLAAEVED